MEFDQSSEQHFVLSGMTLTTPTVSKWKCDRLFRYSYKHRCILIPKAILMLLLLHILQKSGLRWI